MADEPERIMSLWPVPGSEEPLTAEEIAAEMAQRTSPIRITQTGMAKPHGPRVSPIAPLWAPNEGEV